jgi:hypothetical protein
MKRLLGVPLIATVLLVIAASSAEASYCGAVRHLLCGRACCETGCAAPCAMQCSTVMKTCKQIVYEQQQYTCYKTCWERVCEQKVVNCVKYVPQTCYREVSYTVCKPVRSEGAHV